MLRGISTFATGRRAKWAVIATWVIVGFALFGFQPKLQEATTNAARYARAKTIAIDLRSTARKLQLSIADDGIGLSAGLAQRRPGMGLKIMEYRARMLGGTINFEEPNPGTRIVLSAPLHLLKQTREKLSRAV